MADALYLSIWFPSFTEAEMMPRALSMLRQFPYSGEQPGISYVAVQPVSWNEPTVFERRFQPAVDAEEAVTAAGEFLHQDYAYVFEAYWDLWAPKEGQVAWAKEPRRVRLVVHGTEFDDGAYQQEGHIRVDFGLDIPFLYEDVKLTAGAEERVRANVQKLVAFTSAVEQNCGISGRVLWSESEENLAQKLIARLQKVQ